MLRAGAGVAYGSRTHEGRDDLRESESDITDDEIDALAEELSKMYPEGYADYYAGCIYAMQERMG